MCVVDSVPPCGRVHILTRSRGVQIVMMSLLSTASWNWSYPEERSQTEYMDLPAKASANVSIDGLTPVLRMVTLLTDCKAWMKRNVSFFFGIINHRLE